MKRFITVVVVAGAALLIFLMLGPFYVVQEGQQAIILQFGRIVRTKTEAGLALKAPLIDQVVRYPKKIISWDGDPTLVPTQERQFIYVDTTARWRIVDPELFYESVKDEQGAQTRLDAVIDSAVKEVISNNRLQEAVPQLRRDQRDRAAVHRRCPGRQLDPGRHVHGSHVFPPSTRGATSSPTRCWGARRKRSGSTASSCST